LLPGVDGFIKHGSLAAANVALRDDGFVGDDEVGRLHGLFAVRAKRDGFFRHQFGFVDKKMRA
jgi:hypothetical protein